MSGRACDHTALACQSESGFTLLETVVATIIMMVVALGVASLFTYSIKNNSLAGDRTLALAIAQRQLEELRSVSFANVEASVIASGGVSKTVTNGNRTFTVATTYNYLPSPPAAPTWTATLPAACATKRITVTVTPRGDSSSTFSSTPSVFVMQRTNISQGLYR